jgi:formylglycine-generating enzyme required for sulfatase activity
MGESMRKARTLVLTAALFLLVALTTAACPAAAQQLPETYTNSVGMSFVLLDAGTFIMGGPEGDGDEIGLPEHTVVLSEPFYLQVTEVTQGQWEAVMGRNPSSHQGDPRLPVENVSWDEAQEFISKLTAREGGDHYRLPTEAEWEYACRAGGEQKHSCTGQVSDCAWYAGNSGDQTHPVGIKQPNAWGLYDLQGNVWEWTQDFFTGEYLPQGTITDPVVDNYSRAANYERPNKLRVLRGGCMYSEPPQLTCAWRTTFSSMGTGSSEDVGFRVVREP